MSDDVTLGELARRVDRLETTMQAGFAQLGEKMDRLPYVQAGTYESDKDATRDRLTKVETAQDRHDGRAWQVRTSVMVAAMGVPMSVIASVFASVLTR